MDAQAPAGARGTFRTWIGIALVSFPIWAALLSAAIVLLYQPLREPSGLVVAVLVVYIYLGTVLGLVPIVFSRGLGIVGKFLVSIIYLPFAFAINAIFALVLVGFQP